MSRRIIEPEIFGENNMDEYSTRDQPVQKSFYDRYGFDERDGPPEEEEDREYEDDPVKLPVTDRGSELS